MNILDETGHQHHKHRPLRKSWHSFQEGPVIGGRSTTGSAEMERNWAPGIITLSDLIYAEASVEC